MVLFVSKIGMDGLDGWTDGKVGYRTPYGANNLFVDVFFIKDVTIKVCALQKRGHLCKINAKINEIRDKCDKRNLQPKNVESSVQMQTGGAANLFLLFIFYWPTYFSYSSFIGQPGKG